MSRVLLLSVQPKYAKRILNGTKAAELRKVRPGVAPGDTIVLYVSSPEKKVRAVATVRGVSSGHPDQLWKDVSGEAGVTDEEYEDYFGDTDIGYAIHFTDLRLLRVPVALSRLRQFWPGFHPPQVYRYLSDRELANLLSASETGPGPSIRSRLVPQLAA